MSAPRTIRATGEEVGRAFAATASSDLATFSYSPVGRGSSERLTIGPNSSAWFRKDPRAMAYTASKYLTVAKLLEGTASVLEIGCGDGFGAPIIAQHVKRYHGIDFYLPHILEAKFTPGLPSNVVFSATDMLDPYGLWERYDAAIALDVLEHIDPAQEDMFLRQVCANLNPDGVFICGMPTLNSQAHSSEHGKAGHINCQSPEKITRTLRRYFRNVFSFGLTNGHLDQGPEPMRQYQLNLAVGVK